MYLHGGAYMAGPVFLQWKLLAEIHRQTGLAAAMVLYRRPPQNPHPAALDDVVTAIRSLHANGELREGHWVLAGDSAGGQLALSAAQQLRDTGGPMPAGLLLTAPLVDMELAHPDTVAAIDASWHHTRRQILVGIQALCRRDAVQRSDTLTDQRLGRRAAAGAP